MQLDIILPGTHYKKVFDRGDYLEIEFGPLGKVTKIDKESLNLLKEQSWNVTRVETPGRTQPNYYVSRTSRTTTTRRTELLHRLIMKCDPKCRVIHKNGDSLDNRKVNLEVTKNLKWKT